MEKIIVDAFKLDRISSRMAKRYGTIPAGREELFAMPLSAMESNLLKLHRENPSRTGRQALTAVKMALLTIDGYVRQVEYDYEQFMTSENQHLLHGLLMSFDPFTNPEIHEVIIGDEANLDVEEYFKIPVKCLLRIEKSLKLWTDKLGTNGYFYFIEKHMGHLVGQDNKMEFSVVVEDDKWLKR
jgi:hypothetical protein